MTTRRSPVLDTATSSHSTGPRTFDRSRVTWVPQALATRPTVPATPVPGSVAECSCPVRPRPEPGDRRAAAPPRSPTPMPPPISTMPAAAPSATCQRLRSPLLRDAAAEQFGEPRPPGSPPVGTARRTDRARRPGAAPPWATARPARRRRPGIRPGDPRTPAGPAPRAGPSSRRRRRCARCSCRHPPLGQDHAGAPGARSTPAT